MKKLALYLALHPWSVINGGIAHSVYGDEAYNLPRIATIQNSGIMWALGLTVSERIRYLLLMCFTLL